MMSHENDKGYDPTDANNELSDEHLIDLVDNHAVSVEVLQAVNARSRKKGVLIDWTDGSATNQAGRIDPDKRRPDAKGKIRKTTWSQGVTTNLSMVRNNGSDDALIIEGFCQHLAVASWAPEKFDVFGMNGCNGVHDKTDLDWADGKRVVLGFDADRMTKTRVKTAARTVARHLYQAGAESVRVIDLPRELITRENDGPDDVLSRMPEDEREAAIAAWIADAVLIPKISDDDRFSDAAMAQVVADEVFAGEIVWVAGLGWMQWSGQVWKDVDDSVPMEQFRQFVLGKYSAAAAAGQRTEVANWGRMLSRGRGTAVVAYAKGIVRVEASLMDADPDKLNTPSGIVDLRTGKLEPSDPDQFMTKMTRVPYVPGATHPDWDKALQACPEDARSWLQARIGQACTGHMTPDDVLLVNQGNGENGKTSFLTATSRAMGDYYTLVSDRVLMADPSAHPTELMDLMGVRFAALEETPEARHLDTQRLKRTIGTEQITARRIRQDSVTFDATHTLIVNTNYKPEITETDHGTWRRLALLVWPFTFRKGPEDIVSDMDRLGDPTLRMRCKNDPEIQKAALAWMIEGAHHWYAADQKMPPAPERVESDTLMWREESDLVMAFVREHLVIDPTRHIRSEDLRRQLGVWLADKGSHEWSDKTVTTRFGGHDAFTRHHVTKQPQQRRNAKLSRPESGPSAADTAKYAAWLGVRWRTRADDQDQKGPNQDHVPDVPADLVTPKKSSLAMVNRTAGTSGTPQVNSSVPTPWTDRAYREGDRVRHGGKLYSTTVSRSAGSCAPGSSRFDGWREES